MYMLICLHSYNMHWYIFLNTHNIQLYTYINAHIIHVYMRPYMNKYTIISVIMQLYVHNAYILTYTRQYTCMLTYV